MRKITWIKLASKKYGGVVYGQKVRDVLSGDYHLEVKNVSSGNLGWKYFKPLEWFLGLLKIKGESDLWIRDDFYSIAFQFLNRTKGKKLAVVYHLDSSVFPLILRPLLFLLERTFYFNLKKADFIVTIADYWKDYFLRKGYKNVFRISPCLDLSEFNISDEELSLFKRKHNLVGKPIIYLGNCQRAKGVVESYEALKNLDAHFVTSGEEMVKIPAENLNLEHREYLKLLKVSAVALTMSNFKEGWNITAHEAMLLKTPVIGSGRGGMKELLKGGKQIICEDFNLLREKVEYLLDNPAKRKEMGEDGYNFAKQFNLERFKQDWLELINKIIQ